jgi:hypothetical protein
VDVILSIRRGEGNTRPTVRIIESLSRFDETPSKLVIELTEGCYRSLGDATAFAEQEAMKAVVELLPTQEESAMKTEDILDRLSKQNIKRTVATDVLAKLTSAGTIRRVGKGQRSGPYRYYKPATDDEKDSSATPSLGSEERKEDEEMRRTGIIQSERQVFELVREHFGLGEKDGAT